MPMAEQSLMSEQWIAAELEDCLFLVWGHLPDVLRCTQRLVSAAKSLALFIFESGFLAVAVFALMGILLNRYNKSR